jgi:phosphoenolpyruvate carboxykinase (ATP)
LSPSSSWPSKDLYMQRYREMASRFIDNFRKFEKYCTPEVRASGPKY